MKVNGCAYLPSCLPNTFNLLSLCSHSVCFILNCARQKTKFRVLIPMLIEVQICWLLERIRSVFSHIVRRDTSNLPKPSPQCEMVQLHIIICIMFFSLSINLSSEYSMMYLCIVPTKYLPRPPRRQRQKWQWRTLHPLVRNHAKTWWGLGRHRQKIYRRIAGVSARWFEATAE